jgi:protein-tyrosine-phosphatase
MFLPARGLQMSDQMPDVLFLCVHNAGRSQMAAAFAERLGAGRVRVSSAGSTPALRMNPHVVEAMKEVGIDLSHEIPKPLRDDSAESADIVITIGSWDTCPVVPGNRYPDWQFEDPAGQHPRRDPRASGAAAHRHRRGEPARGAEPGPPVP